MSPTPLGVAIDLRYIQDGYESLETRDRTSEKRTIGGIGRVQELIWRGVAKHPEARAFAILAPRPPAQGLRLLLGELPGAGNTFMGVRGLPRRLRQGRLAPFVAALESQLLPFSLRARRGIDLVHFTNFGAGVPPRGVKSVVTVADLGVLRPLLASESWRARAAGRIMLESLERAAIVTCISGAVANELCEFLPRLAHKIRAVHIPYDDTVFVAGRPDPAAAAAIVGTDAPFILHVGVCVGRKNPEGLVEGMRRSLRDAPAGLVLVLVGGYHIHPTVTAALEQRLVSAGLAGRYKIVGDLEDAKLATLYRNTIALLFPSLYEGFGLPPVEAMACGAPTVVSNRGSLAEIAGDAAIQIDPENADSIASGLVRAFDPETRSRLGRAGLERAREFSVARLASKYLDVYREAIAAG